MADDEQFSLCWNNFSGNLSAGFHESLCRGDLVDVTLAAEGQFVKAHRLVLSVCSPYFRKMFTQMPANQHAFVFLKDVSHTALKDLIQFMYCGEVNVKQEALPAFISTAEALQIKGLTDSDPPPSQSPAEPSTPIPQIQQPQQIQRISSPPRLRQRSSTTRSYKIETVDDSGDDNKQPTQIVIQTTAAPQATIAQQTQHLPTSQQQQIAGATTTTAVVTHKRPAQRSIGSAPHIKRTKSTTVDPLEQTDATNNTTQQIIVQTAVVTESKSQQQQQSEPEYIDLPIELPTKSEPDYAEETGEVESAEHDASYVEDDAYADMRYDETYFTENEDAGNASAAANTATTVSATTATTSKAIVKQQATSFSDSSYVDTADQTNNDAQGIPQLRRKRGRPKNKEEVVPQEKLMDKLQAAASNHHLSQPIIYASTTKGAMKLIYQGHHFRYSFRKGQYSIFQCCYKEKADECKVRVVTNQKRVFPLEGEHIHFIQATDKSVTSEFFETGKEGNDDGNEEEIEKPVCKEEEDEAALEHEMKQLSEDIDYEMFADDDETGEEMSRNILDAGISAECSNVVKGAANADDFREKIKKRLQKALLGKKK